MHDKYEGVNMVLHFAEPTDEDRLIKLENKATEIRKVLLGALMLANPNIA